MRNNPRSGVFELTPREAQVLALHAEGLNHKVIAERVGVSVHTVTKRLMECRAKGKLESPKP